MYSRRDGQAELMMTVVVYVVDALCLQSQSTRQYWTLVIVFWVIRINVMLNSLMALIFQPTMSYSAAPRLILSSTPVLSLRSISLTFCYYAAVLIVRNVCLVCPPVRLQSCTALNSKTKKRRKTIIGVTVSQATVCAILLKCLERFCSNVSTFWMY